MTKSLTIPRVSGFSELDRFAVTPVDTVCWPDQFPYAPEVTLRIAHDGRAMLLRFEVTEQNPRAVTLESNGPVWEDSCVEFFVKEPGSRYYCNIETNCIGVSLAAKRLSRNEFQHFDEARMARIVRRPSLPKNKTDLGPGSWSLELEVPFDLICDGPVPPARLEANFYKCGDKTAVPHFLSWNKVDTPSPDFHRPEFFGTLILENV